MITSVGYLSFPAQVVTHWGAKGEPNGSMSRDFNAVFMVGLICFTYGILKFSIKADPQRANIDKLGNAYEWLIAYMMGFFVGVNLFVTLWNLGYQVNVAYFFTPLISGLFIVIGLMLSKVERNYTIGIKTPWTLADDYVWKKTHELGAKLFVIAGLIGLLGLLIVDYAFIFMLVPIFVVVIVLFAYSYYVYRKRK